MSFGSGDPVAAGFASSITRPNGNITGVVMLAPELDAKRLTLLHEAIPHARRIAVLAVSAQRYEYDIASSARRSRFREIRPAGLLHLNSRRLSTPRSRATAFGRCGGAHHSLGTGSSNRDADILAALAVEANLPTVCEWSHMAAQGWTRPATVRAKQSCAAAPRIIKLRIFRGAAPGDLPIEGPTRFEFTGGSEHGRKRLGVRATDWTAAARRRGDRIGGNLLHCICLFLAHRDISRRRSNSVAFGE